METATPVRFSLMAKILLCEDDRLIGQSVVDGLQGLGHTVEWVQDGKEGADRLRLYQYDLAILDWNMPEMTGVEVCRQYREQGGVLPILMLTARDKDVEKVEGLDAGADDYLTKPFSLVELAARIRAILRRQPETLKTSLSLGEIDLLPKEMALLEFLIRHPNQLFDVNDLLNHVWSSESDSTEDAVRQCVARLRRKLEVEGKKSPIVTVKGLGYRLEEVN
jgi:two-component system, OmpR family, manganese sensing response regulator